MSEFKTEHQRYDEGKLGRDFISMAEDAIKLRELIDQLGTPFPQHDLSEPVGVENMSVDEAA